MRFFAGPQNLRGMSFIDVVVGVSIMLVVFLSIFGAYRLAVNLVLNTKARIGGMTLVAQQLEYVRGLPYEMLGTVGGIPQGNIPQTATTSINNIAYTTRTLIKYIDDPADGTGAADSNSVTADYKEIKVETVWQIRGRSYSTLALTRVSPHGIESLTSGGTLRVNVFDAVAAPVGGATVRIQNASTTPTIDITVTSDSGGSVAFPGAPPASNYRITVTKDEYSSAQTHSISTANPNPNPGHVSVANQQTTTASFAIDVLGSLVLSMFSPVEVGSFQDTFTSSVDLAHLGGVEVTGGAVSLIEDPVQGYTSGEARSEDVTPTLLATWDSAVWTADNPAQTSVLVQVVYPTAGTYLAVPDSAIAGNSAGLSAGTVSLAAVSTSTYPTLALRTMLSTTDASTTPQLLDWQVNYHAGPTPLPGVAFTLYGTKTIGAAISGAPIYKVVQNLTTQSDGSVTVEDLEWDGYTVQLTGTSYDIGDECPMPLSISPGEAQISTYTLYPHTTNSLRILVTGNNAPLTNATVTVAGSGGGTSAVSSCGQAFFSGVSSGTHSITISASGYQPHTQDVSVTGRTVITVPLTQL